MKVSEYIVRKKYPIIGFAAGIGQMLVFILTALMTNWEKVSDPIARGHFYVLIPCSILFCILSAISGCLYSKTDYNKPVRYALLSSLVLSLIISLWMFLAGAISSLIGFFANICIMFIIVSLFTLSAALLIGRN